MRGGSDDLAEKVASADPAALVPGLVARADPTAPGPVRFFNALDPRYLPGWRSVPDRALPALLGDV